MFIILFKRNHIFRKIMHVTNSIIILWIAVVTSLSASTFKASIYSKSMYEMIHENLSTLNFFFDDQICTHPFFLVESAIQTVDLHEMSSSPGSIALTFSCKDNKITLCVHTAHFLCIYFRIIFLINFSF